MADTPIQAEMDVERQKLEADIVCIGFGPATAGFLIELSRHIGGEEGAPPLASRCQPGMPLQVLCYERAEDLGFGVSGVVTRARSIRESLPGLSPADIPLGAAVTSERMVYLLDPVGASRRSRTVRIGDRILRLAGGALGMRDDAWELPWIPGFLHKTGGWVLSMGQFMQWAGMRLMGSGLVQLWPGMPVSRAVLDGQRVVGVQLLDQGTDRQGRPSDGFLPGMEVRAELTVVGDGPVGSVGRQLDERFGRPSRSEAPSDWAVGMKMVVDLPENSPLAPGAVYHTFGYPEPEIFGFMYVHPDRVASLGIFVPSWLNSPVRTAYRCLQHWIQHPYLARRLEGARLRSWGAKTLQESGRRAEPFLVGDGFARIGEGSGSTNVLTGSGVDEAWATGAQLAAGVAELWRAGLPMSRDRLEAAYEQRRRSSWVEREARVAERSRDGFRRGIVRGMLGMALAGWTGGRLWWPGGSRSKPRPIESLESFYRGRLTPEEIDAERRRSQSQGLALHEVLMERAGWPPIPHDGRLLVSHQDALLLGGKVQAPPGYADHVVYMDPGLCETCGSRLCIEVCSGQALRPGERGVPAFDREKCVHCGACLWSCTRTLPGRPERSNLDFRVGAGGLHSAEN